MASAPLGSMAPPLPDPEVAAGLCGFAKEVLLKCLLLWPCTGVSSRGSTSPAGTWGSALGPQVCPKGVYVHLPQSSLWSLPGHCRLHSCLSTALVQRVTLNFSCTKLTQGRAACRRFLLCFPIPPTDPHSLLSGHWFPSLSLTLPFYTTVASLALPASCCLCPLVSPGPSAGASGQ